MKKISLPLIFLFLFTAFAAAQETQSVALKKEWITVQSDDKKLSVDLPADLIVDAESNEMEKINRLIGFSNGVVMELTSYRETSIFNFLNDPKFKGERGSTFTKEDFKGYRTSTKDENGILSESINLANKDGYYKISITSGAGQKAEMERFLFSIKLNNKPLFSGAKEQPQTSKTVAVKSFKSSPEVIAALKRKSEKIDRNIIREISLPAKFDTGYAGLSRAPILLKVIELRRTFDYSRPGIAAGAGFTAVFKVTLRADGQIGDIWVYTNSKDKYIETCIDAIKKLKFIPAQKDGVNVDSFEIINLSVFFPGF